MLLDFLWLKNSWIFLIMEATFIIVSVDPHVEADLKWLVPQAALA
jgi:hypothetical protein